MTEAKNLCCARGAELINDLNFRLPGGTICAVAGKDADGGRLLLKLLAGCLEADSGQLRVGGLEPVRMRSRIGFLPDPAPEYPDLSPKALLRFVLGAKGVTGARAERELHTLLSDAGIDERDAARSMRLLDPAQRLSVGMAQALAGDPVLLLVELPEGADLADWGARLRGLLTPERTVFVTVPSYHADLDADYALTLAGGMQVSFEMLSGGKTA